MNPNDPLNTPSSPPPDELPRPRLRNVDGFGPRQSQGVPPRSQPVPPRQQEPAPIAHPQPIVQQPQPQQQPRPVMQQPVSSGPRHHPAEHLLPAPHEPLLTSGEAKASSSLNEPKKKWSLKKKLLAIIGGIIGLLVIAAVALGVYYTAQLRPVSSDASKHVRLTIESGTTPNQIGEKLKEAGLVHSAWAFNVYTYISKTRDDLKAGSYNLLPSQPMSEIVQHLVSGKQDEFSMTFLPGDTLENHRKRLLEIGYTSDEVDQALSASYTGDLFAGRPSSADLEGYIYGQTYNFDSSATAKDVLQRTFDEYEKQAVANKLTEGFKQQGLTFYEGITLASIIQREVSNPTDEKQVAQVFYTRLKAGMTLGSDVTYQYAAKKLGVAPDPSLDSPYNTRKYAGLPPGPISSPGLSALIAAAYPAAGNYLFFLSGDDDKTYFATTNEGHEQNIAAHCQKKCLIN